MATTRMFGEMPKKGGLRKDDDDGGENEKPKTEALTLTVTLTLTLTHSGLVNSTPFLLARVTGS